MVFEERKLKRVLADVLGVEIDRIDEEASIDTIDEWDSLKHLNIVLALEAEFDISFSEEQTVEILTYPLIKIVMGEHDVRFSEQ